MTITSARGATKTGDVAWAGFPVPGRPITPFQRRGLLAFLVVSVIDVAISAFLIFGTGGYVEANPLLAWASGGLLLFVVAGLAVKTIGLGLLVLLVSLANHFFTLAGDSVVVAAVGTTTALFVLMLLL
jgi:hypothetical protein